MDGIARTFGPKRHGPVGPDRTELCYDLVAWTSADVRISILGRGRVSVGASAPGDSDPSGCRGRMFSTFIIRRWVFGDCVLLCDDEQGSMVRCTALEGKMTGYALNTKMSYASAMR